MELSTYITSFREVNSIYAKFIETGLYGFDEQEIVINFFEEIKDIKKLEKVLFESSEALNFQSKFNAFKIVLNENVKLYEGNKELFDSLEVNKLCGIKSSCFDEKPGGERATYSFALYIPISVAWGYCFIYWLVRRRITAAFRCRQFAAGLSNPLGECDVLPLWVEFF